MKKFIMGAAAAVLIFAAILLINLYFDKNVYITEYTYASEKVPAEFDGYKAALISDMHNSKYADKFNTELDSVKADAVIFSGDMIQKPSCDLSNVLKIVRAQKDKSKIFAVFGNHEAQNGYIPRKEIAKQLRENGVVLLQNDFADIKRGASSVRFIGIEDVGNESINAETAEGFRSTAEKCADENLLNILIYHRANLYPELKHCPVDLILSGHLHGGIVRLPFAGGLIGESGKSLFPKYSSGVYKEKNAAEMIVSRGADFSMKKMRIFNPPEIVVITLKCK